MTRLEALRREGFTVGDWTAEPRLHEIARGSQTRRLDPRVMDLLVHLAAAEGDVVSRDELLARVWGDAFVAENTIAQAISRLRKALEDDPHAPRFVETISKSGYRLVAPVTLSESAAPPTPVSPAHALWRAAPALGVTLGLVLAVMAWNGSAPASTSPLGSLSPAMPLLTNVGRQPDPALSPGGDRVAFVWQAPDRGGWDLYVQDVGGQNAVRLTERAGLWQFPAWSSDGRHLVALEDSAGDCAIHRFTVDDAGVRERVADCLPGSTGLRSSPDGRWLAFSAVMATGEPASIVLVDVETGHPRRLTPPADSGEPAFQADVAPAFSPDGRTMAFSRVRTASTHDVMTIGLDGHDLHRLTSDQWSQIRGLDWSADGETIVYATNRGGQYRLWRVPQAGGTPTRIRIEDEWLVSPSLARDRDRLIYRTFNDTIDLWAVSLSPDGAPTGEARRVAASTRSENEPALSPDGGQLAFVSDRSGTMELWSADLAGGKLVQHTSFGGPRPTMPTWSPDGTEIVFGADPAGHFDLFRVDRHGGEPRQVTRGTSDEQNPSFSRDGRWLYFASNRSGEWQLWRMPSDGGGTELVTRDGGFFGQEDPAGQYLYFVKLDVPGIWRQPAAGGDPTLVVSGYDFSDWASWSVTERGIYFSRHAVVDNYPRPTIELFDVESGTTTVLRRPEKQMPYLTRAVTVAADGRTLVFSMIDHSDDEVLVVDLPSR